MKDKKWDRRQVTKLAAAGAAFAATTGMARIKSLPNMIGDPFVTMDGIEQAALVKSGEVTAMELTDAAIKRINAYNPKVNAVITTYFERARSEIENGLPQGPFHGVPFLLKDLLDDKGARTTFGSRMLEFNESKASPPFTKRTRAAGFSVLGKTNTPEFGFLATTEPLLSGPTRNPWNLLHSAGGSSGGAAAAVAAGLVPFAHASDGGGSIRIPASCCGLFGLKPSRGRHVSASLIASPIDISVDNCISRSVRDSAMYLSVVEKTTDQTYPPLGFVEGPSSRRLKVGLSLTSFYGSDPEPHVARAIKKTAKRCEALGHDVEEVTLPFDGEAFIDAFLTLWSFGAYGVAKGYQDQTDLWPDEETLEPFSLGLAAMYQAKPEGALEAALAHLAQVEADMDAMFDDIDVLLTPVLFSQPIKIGEQDPRVPFDTLLERLLTYASYTPLQNACGMPAMSVPLTWSIDGLPIGSHFSARKGDERTLLELAYELEAAHPWRNKWAPNSVVG